MLKRLFAALAFALCFAPAPHARAEAPALCQAEPSQAEIEALVREIGVWSQGANARLQRLSQLGAHFDPIANIMSAVAAGRPSEESRAALANWRIEFDAAARQVRDELRNAPAPPDLSPLGAEAVALQRVLDATTANHLDMLDRFETVALEMERAARAAIAGEADPMMVATTSALTIAGEMLALENAQMESASAALTPNHPTYSLLQARIAVNNALAQHLQLQLLSNQTNGFDAVSETQAAMNAIAADIRARAETMRISAAQMSVGAAASQSTPSMRASVSAMFATFADTAVVLVDIAAQIEALAASYQGGFDGVTSQPYLDAVINTMDILLQHDAQRANLLAGG